MILLNKFHLRGTLILMLLTRSVWRGQARCFCFILLSCAHQNQLLDRWPFLRHLAAGRETHFPFVYRSVCGVERDHLSWFKSACLTWPLIFFLKHESNLNSYSDVRQALPLVDCVHSVWCLYIKLFNHSVRCSLHTKCPAAQSRPSPSSYTYKLQPLGLFTGGASVTAGNRPRANRNTWRRLS